MRIAVASAILAAGLGVGGCTLPPHLAGFDTPATQRGEMPAAQEMLALHNAKRRAHCAPDLTWSSELAAAAQAWADRCEFAHASRSVNPNQGENLARGAGKLGTAAHLFAGWYDEVRQYNFGSPSYQKGTGHFTQIVWRGTREVGCGVATCGGKSFWVCRYAPQGNIVNPGYFEKNVLPVGCKP
ncbi:MAG TPA: CAP family protein [Hyphomicrobiaceae bacterium]|nr:CAP family protein [Hyphomicrobiaceae bacterium]